MCALVLVFHILLCLWLLRWCHGLRSHSQSCRGCCHGSGFWRLLFHDRGREKKKKTLYRVTHRENIHLSAKTTQCDSFCARLHLCVYECTESLRTISMTTPHVSFGPQPRRNSSRSKESTKASKTQWRQQSEREWTNTAEGQVERSERMGQSERRKESKDAEEEVTRSRASRY